MREHEGANESPGAAVVGVAGVFAFRPHRIWLAAGALLAGLLCVLAPRLDRTLGQPLRAHGADLAFAVLLYSAAGVVTSVSPRWRAGAVLGLLCGIEIWQLIGSMPRGGLIVEFTLGATFDPLDLLAYVLGVALAVRMERRADRRAVPG